MFTHYKSINENRGHCGMCDVNCRQTDASYRRCRNCWEIMCNNCHDNMDNTTEVRQEVLQKRNRDMAEHWSFTKKPFMSIADSSNQEEFKRARDVDWMKVEELIGSSTPTYPFDKGCFVLTQEDRIKKAFAEEAAKDGDKEVEGEPDWS